MPLDGVARPARPDRGAAVQDPARDRRPEPARPHGRRADQRRRLRDRLVRRGRGPGVYHSVSPAWSDANLRELAAHIESPLFIAHMRAAIGSPVQQTNCHPFRHGRWLFVHNGYLGGFHGVRRDLMLAIDPELFADVSGSTDTEVVFHLALTHGLEDDPIGALERTVGLIEATAAPHGIPDAVQGTFAVTDGELPVGRALRHRRAAALAVRVHRRRRDPPPVSRERPPGAADGGRPADRLRAVRRPARAVAGDPARHGGLGAPRRRARGAAVHPRPPAKPRRSRGCPRTPTAPVSSSRPALSRSAPP